MKKSQSLNVGLVFDDSLDSNDGVAQYVKTVGAWLSRQGHDVSYLVGQTNIKEWSGGKVYSLATNKKVTFNGNRLSVPLPASKKPIANILREVQFDILHVMVPYSPFMAQKVINMAPKSTAVVGTFHIFPSGAVSRIGSRFLRLVNGRSLNRFLTIVSVSQAAADFAKKSFGISTPVIPNAVDLSLFNTEASKVKADKYSIVFLGRLVKRKGARSLIEAFALLAANEPRAKLVVAGNGPQRAELEALVKQLKIDNKVRFLGYIDEHNKPRLLAGAAIACFPSLYGESFGIVLVEAMAARSAVVLGGDNPGYRSVLGAQPVLLVEPQNKRIFANRLEELLNDKNLRDSLLAWQSKEVKQYDIEVVGQDLVNIYKMAIARQTKTGHNK